MKYEINMAGITRRVPTGCKLPAALGQLVDVCRQIQRGDLGWFAVKHTAPKELLGFDSGESILPFMRLGDGGFVAFWFQSKSSPAVVHCDSEGGASVVAATFADFLLRLARQKTSVPDLDQQESSEPPSFKGLPKRVAALAQKRKEFKAWIASNVPETATADDESEVIRQELQRVLAKDMAASILRLQKLYGDESPDDDDCFSMVDIIVHLTPRSWKVTTIGGQPFPKPDRLRKVMDRLSAWLGHSLKKTEVSVWSDGRVFLDKNTTLGNPTLYDE